MGVGIRRMILRMSGLGGFDMLVLEAVLRLRFGETVTYRGRFRIANNPGACRAVGNALNRNPLPIAIPCHRIINAGGKPENYKYGR